MCTWHLAKDFDFRSITQYYLNPKGCNANDMNLNLEQHFDTQFSKATTSQYKSPGLQMLKLKFT